MPTWIGKFDKPRQRLLTAIATQSPPTTLKQLSLAIGRNHAYLQQYLRRGSPFMLPEDARHQLAGLLGIHESELRPDTLPAAMPASVPVATEAVADDAVLAIGFLAHPAHQHIQGETWHIGRLLTHTAIAAGDASGASPNPPSPPALKLVVAGDDAMAPAISKGDIIIIDTADTDPRLGGLFAIDAGDHIRVRYVEQPDIKRADLILRHETSRGFAIRQPRHSIRLLGRGLWRFGAL